AATARPRPRAPASGPDGAPPRRPACRASAPAGPAPGSAAPAGPGAGGTAPDSRAAAAPAARGSPATGAAGGRAPPAGAAAGAAGGAPAGAVAARTPSSAETDGERSSGTSVLRCDLAVHIRLRVRAVTGGHVPAARTRTAPALRAATSAASTSTCLPPGAAERGVGGDHSVLIMIWSPNV